MIWLLSILAAPFAESAAPPEMTARHTLAITLFPEKQELSGRDRIRIDHPADSVILLGLSSGVRISRLQVDGADQPHRVHRAGDVLRIDVSAPAREMVIDVAYHGRFDDPAPVRPINSDNPGYGVSGTISTRGVFLAAGAGWYPAVAGARETVDLEVMASGEMVAVTGGRLVDIRREAGSRVSIWHVNHAIEGLSLSAGPYVVDRQARNGFSASTWFEPANQALSPGYLAATLDYLERYSRMFGDYAYDAFAVVENFFPTGYGFPGYTLMGGRVLQLPFIPHTSLPHEIVHNWWGNGVRVDFSSGNWCEGLATYTADYLNAEHRSPSAARDYRLQALRNFASLVTPEHDFPLNRFRSRTDPATKAIGYDKAAMVFHMLRREIGETAFWGGLRDLYDQFLFKTAGWGDLKRVFEVRAGRPLSPFFSQWIDRPGAPRVHLEAVEWQADGNSGYRTTGRIVQAMPAYAFLMQLRLETDGEAISRTVRVDGRETAFDMRSETRPLALQGDPDVDLFRQLTPMEIPPTVNTLKSSPSLAVVVSDGTGPAGEKMARDFVRAMGIGKAAHYREKDLPGIDPAVNDILFIGVPGRGLPESLFPPARFGDAQTIRLGSQNVDPGQTVLFTVDRQPHHPNRLAALFQPGSASASNDAIVKIPHYGRYSYLAFKDGRNQLKGTWETENSPLTIRWSPNREKETTP